MKSRLLLIACVALVATFSWARGEDKPAVAKPDSKVSDKMVLPWSRLSSLTDEQKAQIKEIHAKANDEVKAIRDKEKADILGLLTDEQKEELKTLAKDSAVKKKAAAGAEPAVPAAKQ